MKNNLIDEYASYDTIKQFENLPGRVFLDTNVLQYLQDFGEYIFDNYNEHDEEECFVCGKTTITKDDRLYGEIEALVQIFGINVRTPFEIAVSDNTFLEVSGKRDSRFNQWFYDVLDHWQLIMSEYQDSPFSAESQAMYEKAKTDTSLLGSFSEKDQKIVLDAIKYDCDAILTTDFAKEKNKQRWVWDTYKLAIVTPSEFVKMIKPFVALF